MSNEANRRDFTRCPVHVTVEVRAEDGSSAEGEVENVSLNGCYVRCDESLPDDTMCEVTLRLHGGNEDVLVEARGVVIRHGDYNMAIEFKEVEAEGFEHLQRLVLYNAPDAEQAEDEIDRSLGIKRQPE